MITPHARQHQRLNLSSLAITDHFFLQTKNQRVIVPDSILDLSEGGIKMVLSIKPTIGVPISVNYYSQNWTISLSGQISWFKANSSGSYETGIAFLHHEHQECEIFCELIRSILHKDEQQATQSH